MQIKTLFQWRSFWVCRQFDQSKVGYALLKYTLGEIGQIYSFAEIK